jgi:hypothetical protein
MEQQSNVFAQVVHDLNSRDPNIGVRAIGTDAVILQTGGEVVIWTHCPTGVVTRVVFRTGEASWYNGSWAEVFRAFLV